MLAAFEEAIIVTRQPGAGSVSRDDQNDRLNELYIMRRDESGKNEIYCDSPLQVPVESTWPSLQYITEINYSEYLAYSHVKGCDVNSWHRQLTFTVLPKFVVCILRMTLVFITFARDVTG